MKKGMTYVIAICVTVAVVATCALFPPFLARQKDKSLLNVVKQDTSVSESYEYKATNYQKIKVLYEVCGYSFGYFRHFQMRTDMYGSTAAVAESSAEKWTEEEIAAYEMEMSSYGYPIEYAYTPSLETFAYAQPDTKMSEKEAGEAIIREIKVLQDMGVIPKFALNEKNPSEVLGLMLLKASDPAVANQDFYYWQASVTDPQTGAYYTIIIDDDLSKIYFVELQDISENQTLGALTQAERKAKIDAFASYHDLSVTEIVAHSESDKYTDMLCNTDNPDFQVLQEIEKAEGYSSFRMILKPSDIV
ncbi:MAG: hypothetical protein VB082_06470 [Christensenella sp.]|nr:hypothetical protein [Christensenella sp.]